MMKSKKNSSSLTDPAGKTLRQQAEEALLKQHLERGSVSPEDARRLSHELEVHQIELEMQNEELRRAQVELEASRAQYFDLYDLAPVGYCTISQQGIVLGVNFMACSLLGIDKSMLVGKPLSRCILKEDADSYYLHRKKLFETGEPQACELRMLRQNADPFWVRMEATVAHDGESGDRVSRVVISDITFHKQMEEAQKFLLQCGYLHPGEDFFATLAKYLADTLQMDFVCIDRLEGDGLNARTVAIWCDAHFEDNITYALHDTPCGAVVGKAVCCFEKDVRLLFPHDAELQKLRAEGYVGVTLWSNTGKPIGLIAVISRRPLANPRLVESVLMLVALRAAGELERREAQELLKKANEELHAYAQELETANAQLQEALADIKTLKGLLPICANCKNIRNDDGYWERLETYISDRTGALFSHGICPDCAKKLYPEYMK